MEADYLRPMDLKDCGIQKTDSLFRDFSHKALFLAEVGKLLWIEAVGGFPLTEGVRLPVFSGSKEGWRVLTNISLKGIEQVHLEVSVPYVDPGLHNPFAVSSGLARES